MAHSLVDERIQLLDLAVKHLKDSQSCNIAGSSGLLAILDILPLVPPVDDYTHLPLPAPAQMRENLPPNTPISLTDEDCQACVKQFRRDSDTIGQFWSMRHELVVATMDRLRFGSRSRNKKRFEPATRNKFGCFLVQKKPNKAGYPQVRPIAEVVTIGRGKTVPGESPLQQHGHRLAMLEIGERPAPVYGQQQRQQTIREVLEAGGLEISHLCHYNNCINTDHMVFEDARTNAAVGMCAGEGSTVSVNRCLGVSWGHMVSGEHEELDMHGTTSMLCEMNIGETKP